MKFKNIYLVLIVLLIILYLNKYKPVTEQDDEKFSVESGYYDSDNALRLGRFYSEKNRNINSFFIAYSTQDASLFVYSHLKNILKFS